MPFSKKAVGQSIDRIDGREKVLGRALFAADHRIPDLAYAVVVQSEIPHGSVNTSGLEAVIKGASHAPGVLYILSSENCSAVKELPSELTDDFPFERRPPLSDNSVQHVGQYVAVAVAESLENATHAASLLHFDYEPEPAILSAVQVTDASGTASLGEGRVRQGSYLPDHFVKLTQEKLQDTRGHADPAVEAFRIAQTYTTPVQHHNPIELSSTIASWNGDYLTVYDSTRWIVGSRKTIASYLDMPEANVRIICPYVGGSFGSKSFLWQHVVLVAIAARAVGRPVKLVLTRPQMFTSVGHRPATIQEMVLGADGDGSVAWCDTPHRNELAERRTDCGDRASRTALRQELVVPEGS